MLVLVSIFSFAAIGYCIASRAPHSPVLGISTGRAHTFKPPFSDQLSYFLKNWKQLKPGITLSSAHPSLVLWMDGTNLVSKAPNSRVVPVITDSDGCFFLPETVENPVQQIVPVEFAQYHSGASLSVLLYQEATNAPSPDRDAFLTNTPLRKLGPFLVPEVARDEISAPVKAPPDIKSEALSLICFPVPHGIQIVFDASGEPNVYPSSLRLRDHFGNMSEDGRNLCWRAPLDLFGSTWEAWSKQLFLRSNISVGDCLRSTGPVVLQKPFEADSAVTLQTTDVASEPRSPSFELTNDSHHDDIYLQIPKSLPVLKPKPKNKGQ
jgi:hypothetical protein